MGKALKNKKNKKRRAKPYEVKKSTAMDIDEESGVPSAADPAPVEAEGPEEDEKNPNSSHAVKKRHTAQWKAMKAEVALLKKQRQTCRTKRPAERERKKEISQKIKTLIDDLTRKHEDELEELGFAPKTSDFKKLRLAAKSSQSRPALRSSKLGAAPKSIDDELRMDVDEEL